VRGIRRPSRGLDHKEVLESLKLDHGPLLSIETVRHLEAELDFGGVRCRRDHRAAQPLPSLPCSSPHHPEIPCMTPAPSQRHCGDHGGLSTPRACQAFPWGLPSPSIDGPTKLLEGSGPPRPCPQSCGSTLAVQMFAPLFLVQDSMQGHGLLCSLGEGIVV
jgi:hypothetical protein